MNGRMMFGGVVAKIGGSGFPEMAKLALRSAASEPVQTHNHRFEAFACNVVGYNSVRCGVVCLYRCWRLLVAHFFQGVAGGNGLPEVDEKGGEFCLRCGRYDGFYDLGDGHDGAVVWWSVGIAGHEKCPPALLRAFGSERYEASMCTTRTMSLA